MSNNHSIKRVSYHGSDTHASIPCLEQARPKEEQKDSARTLDPNEAKNLDLTVEQMTTYLLARGLLNELDSAEFSPRHVKRCRNRAYDLVGIETNPGPVTGKKLLKMLRQTGTAIPAPAKSKRQQKKAKKRNVQGGSNQNLNGVGSGNMLTSSPSSFGFVAPKSYFRMGTGVQQLAEQDARSGVRCSGCALYGGNVQSYTASSPTGITLNGAFGSSGSPNVGFALISPNSVDPRLADLAQTYQYYAFRKIIVRYVPAVATSTNGALFLGIAKDPYAASIEFAVVGAATGNSGGTPQMCLDYDPSLMTTIWQPALMEFQHNGTKLWETEANSVEPLIERIQAALVGITQSPAITESTATLWGFLWIEYVVDLYVPGAPLGSN
jgi:hypothetical protein